MIENILKIVGKKTNNIPTHHVDLEESSASSYGMFYVSFAKEFLSFIETDYANNPQRYKDKEYLPYLKNKQLWKKINVLVFDVDHNSIVSKHYQENRWFKNDGNEILNIKSSNFKISFEIKGLHYKHKKINEKIESVIKQLSQEYLVFIFLNKSKKISELIGVRTEHLFVKNFMKNNVISGVHKEIFLDALMSHEDENKYTAQYISKLLPVITSVLRDRMFTTQMMKMVKCFQYLNELLKNLDQESLKIFKIDEDTTQELHMLITECMTYSLNLLEIGAFSQITRKYRDEIIRKCSDDNISDFLKTNVWSLKLINEYEDMTENLINIYGKIDGNMNGLKVIFEEFFKSRKLNTQESIIKKDIELKNAPICLRESQNGLNIDINYENDFNFQLNEIGINLITKKILLSGIEALSNKNNLSDFSILKNGVPKNKRFNYQVDWYCKNEEIDKEIFIEELSYVMNFIVERLNNKLKGLCNDRDDLEVKFRDFFEKNIKKDPFDSKDELVFHYLSGYYKRKERVFNIDDLDCIEFREDHLREKMKIVKDGEDLIRIKKKI